MKLLHIIFYAAIFMTNIMSNFRHHVKYWTKITCFM